MRSGSGSPICTGSTARTSGRWSDLTAAMEGYTDEELGVVRRWLEDMATVITRHSHGPTAAGTT